MRNFIELIFDKAFTLERSTKKSILFFLDVLLISISYYLSVGLSRNNIIFNVGILDISHYAIVLSGSIILLYIFNLYREVTRFVSLNVLVTTATSSLLAGILCFVSGLVLSTAYAGLATSIIFSLLLCTTLGGLRLIITSYFSSRLNTNKKHVLIYGAGSAGRQLATSLMSGGEYFPMAFIDDDKSLEGASIQGIKIYNSSKLKELVSEKSIDRVLLAVPSISRAERKSIINKVEKAGVAVQTIPGMTDIVSGKMKIDEFQNVDIEDLLGRDPVPPVQELLEKDIRNNVVMVTGAGGSIGAELCRQIVNLKPSVLVLYEISEYNLYAVEQELRIICDSNSLDSKVKPVLGSVCDRFRLQSVMNHFEVDTIYHAAAYKHVPMVELNVLEGINNNIFGTLNAAMAAVDAGVKSFVLISTDKAVRPTNVMGATKRVAELVLQGLGSTESNIRFSIVRFGNVLGSSGSVVPLFKKQIRNGGPLTVTHPDITRYFMTIPEAAQLVIQAGAMAKGGDVFVLDMGEPVKIVELAEKLILLMGLELKNKENPDGEISIKYTGLRPGEKLFEELLVGSNVEGTVHPRIMTATERYLPWKELENYLSKLKEAYLHKDYSVIREVLRTLPTDFSPSEEFSDLLCEAAPRSNENVISMTKRRDT
ncbi:polysaccharide biosynthesis protein [Kangiella sediminilitoris]|uniref:Protein WbgZ n=1 Tax=Kangiella sediminilitoris TaxID=1144748 RepID=A0A1B3BBI7_9GAMM|nr:nucleoside-diphosphate sugar epimerase/dehydratase [Kangiella sediminilitoris]AOE50142.1 Protein WbgZ [Kangiella sediminilitoris]